MAAIFPIPYDSEPHRGRRVRRETCTVLSFDAERKIEQINGSPRTRPGALLALALGAIVAFVMIAAVFSLIDNASQPPASAPVVRSVGGVSGSAVGHVVVVQSGDTLTSIARRIQPTGDVGGLVDRLASRHGSGPLQPGERLIVD